MHDGRCRWRDLAGPRSPGGGPCPGAVGSSGHPAWSRSRNGPVGPGPRPPWRWAVTTPSGPRRSCTAARARPARASVSLTPPQKPDWPVVDRPRRHRGRPGAVVRPSAGAGRRVRRSGPGPPGGRSPRPTPNRPSTWDSGRAAKSPRVRMPNRSSSSARSGWPRMPTGKGARKSAVPPGGTMTAARAASTAANSPSATPTSTVVRAEAVSVTDRTSASSPPK